MSGGSGPLRIVVVDDHPVVRDGLRGQLESQPDFDVVGEAADAAEALVVVAASRPDVVLTDLRMPGAGGAELIKRLRREDPGLPILVFTTYDDDTDVLPALTAGATGYLLKDVPRQELFRAVRAAAKGESVLAPSVAARVLARMRNPTPATGSGALSPREREVLSMVAAGHTNREIAAALFIGEATVKTHLLHLYSKLGVADRAAAVAVAYQRGLLA